MPARPPMPALRRFASTVAESSAAGAATQRVYTDRKAFLYQYYNHLLSRNQLVLLFSHANLSVKDSQALRRAINKVPVPTSAVESETVEKATLTIARTGLLQPVVRAASQNGAVDLTPDSTSTLESHLQGPTALITCPSLSPKYLSGMLTAIERTLKSAKRDDTPDEQQPAFALRAGLLERARLMSPDQVRAASKLPELDQLRGQLVGLLEMPQRQLVGSLSSAAGGQLVRTLQGLEESLKEKEAPAASS